MVPSEEMKGYELVSLKGVQGSKQPRLNIWSDRSTGNRSVKLASLVTVSRFAYRTYPSDDRSYQPYRQPSDGKAKRTVGNVLLVWGSLVDTGVFRDTLGCVRLVHWVQSTRFRFLAVVSRVLSCLCPSDSSV